MLFVGIGTKTIFVSTYPTNHLLFGGALYRPPPEGLPVLLGQPAPCPRFPLGGALVRPPPEGLLVLLGQPPPRFLVDLAIPITSFLIGIHRLTGTLYFPIEAIIFLSCAMQFCSARSHRTVLISLYVQCQKMRLSKPPKGFK